MRLSLIGSFLFVLTACGSKAPDSEDDSAAPATSETDEPSGCDTDFGDPEALKPGLDGQIAVLEGTAEHATNIVVVAPAECEELDEGLRGALVVVGDEAVVLFDGADMIACGCPIAEHALCAEMPEGEDLRAKGTVRYANNGMCDQVPCYEMDVTEVCAP